MTLRCVSSYDALAGQTLKPSQGAYHRKAFQDQTSFFVGQMTRVLKICSSQI